MGVALLPHGPAAEAANRMQSIRGKQQKRRWRKLVSIHAFLIAFIVHVILFLFVSFTDMR